MAGLGARAGRWATGAWRAYRAALPPRGDRGAWAFVALGGAGAAGALSFSQPSVSCHGGDRGHGGFSSFATTAIHTGQEPDPQTGAVTPPIVLATTFAQTSPGVHPGRQLDSSYRGGFDYSRSTNPTRGSLEIALAACEGGKHCSAFGSGMAAIGAVAIGLLKAGDHCLMIDDAYGGTQRLFRHTAQQMGITFDLVDLADLEALERALVANPFVKMIWIESPTNPTLKIVDIQAIANLARKYGCVTVVDNTFASPYLQNPLALGVDVVVHSVTKYIGGHSDVLGGAVITDSDELAAKIRGIQNSYGGVPSPFDCYLAARGLKTLHVRMAEHQRNAQAVAEFLESHPQVESVRYPGLASHPQHDLAKKQMRGFGGMVTFYVRGGMDEARTFLESLRIFAVAESLGAVESLAESPAVMTHHSVPAAHRAAMGISDNLIRLSIGLEGKEDLMKDLGRALEAAGRRRA